MNSKGQAIVIFLMIFSVSIFFLVLIIIDADLVSNEDVLFCESQSGEQIYSIIGQPKPGCKFTSCDKSFDGIIYCETKTFKVKNNQFVYEGD